MEQKNLIKNLVELRKKNNLFGFFTEGDEVDQIISEMEADVFDIKLKQKFYYKGSIKMVTYVSAPVFEWDCGWAELNQLRINPDENSRVKWILHDRCKYCSNLAEMKGYRERNGQVSSEIVCRDCNDKVNP